MYFLKNYFHFIILNYDIILRKNIYHFKGEYYMSIFNKDSLKDTLSKLSNSAMDVAENVVKATKESANNVAKKSNDILEISKLSISITSERNKIEELYHEIGKSIYTKYSNNVYIDPDIVDICKDIRESDFKIAVMEDRIADLKNLCKCVNCGESLREDDKFCPSCGHEQEFNTSECCNKDDSCKETNDESCCCNDDNCSCTEKTLEETTNDSNDNDSNNVQ